MAGLKKGDRVYFSSVGRLVNEGTVEEIQGMFVKVRSRFPVTGGTGPTKCFPPGMSLPGLPFTVPGILRIRQGSR